MRLASRAGFDLCGIARAGELTGHRQYVEAWADGPGLPVGYIRRYSDRIADPCRLVAGARSVIVCTVGYKNSAWDQVERGVSPRIASYAWSRDYHVTIKQMLRQVLAGLQEHYPGVSGRCFVDTAPLLEKQWAVEAGLGARGRNSLLITPQLGSFVLLGEVVIDAVADEYNRPLEWDPCGDCSLCVETCPAGALIPPAMVDTRRCISRLTVEKLGENEKVDAADLNGWLFGCDECQSCCPHNRHTPLFGNEHFTPVIPPQTDRVFWEKLTEKEFDDIFGNTPVERAGYERVKGNMPK